MPRKAKVKAKTEKAKSKTATPKTARSKIARPKTARPKTKAENKTATKPTVKAATEKNKTEAVESPETTRPAKPKARPKPPKGMTRTQSKGYHKNLVVKKRELSEAYNKNKNYGRTTEDAGTQDLADKASNSYTKEFLYSLSNTDREVLQKVDDALIRIANGSFGICVECGDSLNKKRLEAVPWASHCLSCQEKVERGLL